MWSYVITQTETVEMKWENYKITVLENLSLCCKQSSSLFFLALTLQCIFIQQKCIKKNIDSANSHYASQLCTSEKVI